MQVTLNKYTHYTLNLKMIIVVILYKVDKAASATPAPIHVSTVTSVGPCHSLPKWTMEEEARGPAMVVAVLLLAVGGALARAALLLMATAGGELEGASFTSLGSLRSIRIAFSTSTSYSASV